jgi:hypothetical protein
MISVMVGLYKCVIYMTKAVDVAVMALCLWEVPGSSLSQVTDHPDRFFLVFLSLLVNVRIIS